MSRIVYRITDEYAIVERKGSANLYLEWREKGQKVGRSTGSSSLDDAKRRARELILELAEIKDAEPAEAGLLAILERYYLKRGKTLPSASTAKRSLALWKEHWGDEKTVADLTVKALEAFIEWLRGKGYADGYVRRVVGFGRTATNWAWKQGELRQVPFIELPQGGESYPHKATRQQLVMLLNTPLPEHVWTYILIRLNTGCRGDAALDLQPFQVDWEDNAIRLNPAGRRQTKKRRPVVPLTKTLAAHLKTLQGVEYYAGWHGKRTRSLKTTWRKIRTKAKLPAWFAPKVLRHTVASELRRRGVPKWDVAGLLGHEEHSASATTGDYAKFDGEKVRKALDAWMGDLAKEVPALVGVTSGSVRRTKKNGATPESRAVPSLQVVGGTGFEPVTPTMSRSRKIK
jgi:integrase